MTSVAPTSRTDSEGGLVTSDSKKRSKLGYHRTAVACSHCRRRKIRCVPSSDLPDAKCQNCLRLKKDCHFHPVDQQEVISKKSRSGLKADAMMADANTSRISPSPESSIDAPLSSVESNTGPSNIPATWGQTNYTNSPVAHVHSYSFSQQPWLQQVSSNTQSPYIRHNSVPGSTQGQYYLPTDLPSAMPYGQRQFLPSTTSALASESRSIYSNAVADDPHYFDRRTTFSPAQTSNNLLETSPTQYAPSFSGPERRQTLPMNYSSHPNQFNLQSQPGLGQYTLASQYVPQHSQQSFYGPNTTQQIIMNQPPMLLSQDPGRYMKYPP